MAIVTIFDLPEIPSIKDADVLPVVGVSDNVTYKVTTKDLLSNVFPYSGSAQITGSLGVTGSISVTDTIFAQTLKVSIVSSSIIYSSGSNIFGDEATDVQQMTGSFRVNGNGEHYILGGNFRLGTIPYVGSDTDVFLVSNGGVISYRTGNDVRSDIGAGTGNGTVTSVGGTGTVNGITLTGTVTGTGNLTLGGTLSGINLTSQVSNTLPVGNGGTGTNTTFTQGSVIFAGASGIYSQNNAGLFFDNSNVRLGINTASPSQTLEVNGKGKIISSLAVGSITPSATAGRIDASNDVVAFSTSDVRYKENVQSISKALEKVAQISGVEFDWIEDSEVHGNSGHDVGVIAQDIEKVLPEVVTTRENGVKAVKYDKIVPLLIEAIKDLQKQIEELKSK